jgi:ubiquitin carboxyl-terminal hydrolase 14
MTIVKAKWGKLEFDIPVDQHDGSTTRSDHILSFISRETNIPKDKIKVLPATALNDTVPIKDGSKVTIIGTAAEKQLSAAPVAQVTQFIEDMTEEEIAKALRLRTMEPLPIGLENLGNTCYLNSVIQCLLWLPEFRKRVQGIQNSRSPLVAQLQQLGSTLDSTGSESITPLNFVATVRTVFPQFNQRDNHGHYSQQDADEFLRAVLHGLGDQATESLFEFNIRSEWKCLESDSEPKSEIHEAMKSLTCHMGTQLEPISHLHEGIQLSLKETIEKEANSLGRSARFQKTSGMDSLPEYLVVQLARFQWKAKSDNAGTQATKTKVVRKITFQKNLDVYDFCTENLQSVLDTGRERRRVLLEQGASMERVQGTVGAGDSQRLPTGTYELVAICSHEGRTADSGHYMAFAKRPKQNNDEPSADEPPTKKVNGKKENEDYWVKFNDDTVSETTWTAMTETGGMMGGLADSQMAYLLFYAKTSVSADD